MVARVLLHGHAPTDPLPVLALKPVHEWVVDKRFQDGDHAIGVGAHDSHNVLTRDAECPLDAAHLHRADEHARQAEGHALGEAWAFHRHFEAVAKVDVHDAARRSVEHEVGRVAVAQSQNVAHLTHERRGALLTGRCTVVSHCTLSLVASPSFTSVEEPQRVSAYGAR